MAEPTISASDHRNGLNAHSPLSLLFMVTLCAAAYVIFSLLQITSTEQTIFDLLQLSVQVKPNMTGAQVAQALNGSLSHNQTIADAIGWAVQIALTIFALPPEQALAAMHVKYNSVSSASLALHAEKIHKIRKFAMGVLIGGDVLTDFYYVSQGNSLLSWDGWHPSLGGNAGVFLVGVLYPVAVCFVTIFAGKYMFAFLDALISVLTAAFGGKPLSPAKTQTTPTK